MQGLDLRRRGINRIGPPEISDGKVKWGSVHQTALFWGVEMEVEGLDGFNI